MPQDQVRQVTLNVDLGYAKSILGICKVLEFLFLLISWACMADCCVLPSGTMFNGRYGFFLFVLIFGWLCIMVFYAIYLLMLADKLIKKFDSRFLLLGFEVLWALLILISASLVGQVANYYATVGTTTSQLTSQLSQLGQAGSKAAADVNENLGVSKRFYQTMGAGVAFGFFALVVFIVDIVVLIIKIVKARRGSATNPAPESSANGNTVNPKA
ncbi:uncharacterized protein [Porites lutea]|uniref:uncharacterized protein n=1 Tax=Porites lutea TaxID=51062 RepID=UPI003CC6AD9C